MKIRCKLCGREERIHFTSDKAVTTCSVCYAVIWNNRRRKEEKRKRNVIKLTMWEK